MGSFVPYLGGGGLLTTGISGGGAAAGAGSAAAGAGGLAAAAGPIAAALALIGGGVAYGVSPTVRKKTNRAVKKTYEGITNPFQHFGDGSDKDTLSPWFKPLASQGGILSGLNGQLDHPQYGKNGMLDTMSTMPQVQSNPVASLNQPQTQQQSQQRQQQPQRRSPTQRAMEGLYESGGLGGMSPIPIAGLNPPSPPIPIPSTLPRLGERMANQYLRNGQMRGMGMYS